MALHDSLHVFCLSFADPGRCIGSGPLGEDLLHHHTTGSLDELLQFVQVLFYDITRYGRKSETDGDGFFLHVS